MFAYHETFSHSLVGAPICECQHYFFDSENYVNLKSPIALHKCFSFKSVFLKMDKMHLTSLCSKLLNYV